MYAERTEVVFLVAKFTESGADIAALRQRTVAWWEQFFALGMGATAKPPTGDFGALLKYRSAHLACPLLVGGLCSVYAARPVGCRTHAAIGPRAACTDDKQRIQQQFLTIPVAWMIETLREQCENAPQALFEFDHLGVWLGHLLLGKTERSAAGHTLIVNQSAPCGVSP